MDNNRHRKVLVVDDSFANRMLMYKIFKTEYEVELAEDGVKALEKLRSIDDISVVILDIMMPELDGFGVLNVMRKEKKLSNIPVIIVTASEDTDSQLKALDLGAIDVLIKPLNYQIVLHRVRNILIRNEAIKLEEQNRIYEQLLHQSEIDDVSGLYNSKAFCRKAHQVIKSHPDVRYVIVRWDIDRFKVFNDVYGIKEGDRFLAGVGSMYLKMADEQMICGRWEADHFVICMPYEKFMNTDFEYYTKELFSGYSTEFEFIVRFGVYKVDEPDLDVGLMCDRALLALRSIKGSYTKRIQYYNESMRAALIEEQQIISEMKNALNEGQFVVYFQPQYNYANKQLHGAEALVRWIHPVNGLISPGKFIPVFEKNGFITQVDMYVWEQVCKYQRSWLDRGLKVVPVSVNVSRIDIYNHRLCEVMTGLLKKYNLDASLIRLEITESAYMDNAQQLISVVEKLRSFGFYVEMDDFGSGYSSLNTLKEVPVDMLKLDMKFMERTANDEKSGSILSSVVRMAHMIKLLVIAEGVETKDQADYLKSIGCLYMQGFYFAKPVSAEEYEKTLCETEHELSVDSRFSNDIADSEKFLNASTQATLLFNSFVGGAAIIEYDGKNVEVIRMNDKYFEVLGIRREDFVKYGNSFFSRLDSDYRKKFTDILDYSIKNREESACELSCESEYNKDRKIWTSVRVRLIAVNIERYIFYIAIDDISQRMNLMESNTQLTQQLTAIMDSVPGGIADFEISDKLRIVYFNDNAAEMFGYSRDEYECYFVASPESAIHPDDIEMCTEKIKKIIESGKKQLSLRYRHKCKNGKWRWVQLTGRLAYKKDDMLYTSCIILDIDAQIKSEVNEAKQAKEIERQKYYLQSLFNSVPCGIAQYSCKDNEYTLVSFNDASWNIYGYLSREQFIEEMHRKSKFKDIHPHDIDSVMECINKVRRSQKCESQNLEHRIIMPDKTVKWVHSWFQKVFYSSYEEMIQIVFTDITEYKKESFKLMGDALLRVFEQVYECDVEQDICTLYDCQSSSHIMGGRVTRLKKKVNELCSKIIYPDDAARALEFFSFRDAAENETSSLEYRYIGDDKKIYWALSTVIHAGGSIYLICYKDITAQKNAQTIKSQNDIFMKKLTDQEKNNESLNLFIQKTGTIIFDYSKSSDIMKLLRPESDGSQKTEIIKDYIGTLNFNKSVSMGDRQSVLDAFNSALRKGTNKVIEFRSDIFGYGYKPCRMHMVSAEDESGRVVRIFGYISDIQDELNQHLHSEYINRIKSSDNARTEEVVMMLSRAANKHKAVSDIIEIIGRQLNVSRVYIVEDSKDGIHCSNTYEWCNDSVESEIDNLQNCEYPEQVRGHYYDVFDENGVFACSDVKTLPKWYRDILDPQKVKAVLQCSMIIDGKICGFIGFDECNSTREWTISQIHTLRAITQVIGYYLSGTGQQYEITQDIISRFEDSSAFIYIIDADTYEIQYMNKVMRRGMPESRIDLECYMMFMKNKPCEICPVRLLGESGFPVPAEVMMDNRQCITSAYEAFYNSKKVFVITGADTTNFSEDPVKLRKHQYEKDLLKYSHTLSGMYDEIGGVDFENNSFKMLKTRFVQLKSAESIEAAVSTWTKRIEAQEEKEAFAGFVSIANIQKKYREKKLPELEYKVKFDDNSIHWIYSVLFPVNSTTYIICNNDITEKRNAEIIQKKMLVLQSQADAQEKYRIVVDQTDTAVFEMNYMTGEFSCSDAYYKYAASRQEHGKMLMKENDINIVHPDDQQAVKEFFDKVKKGTNYAHIILRIRMTDDTYRWTKMSATFVRDESGKLIKSIGTFTDVENEIHAKLELEHVNERMKKIISSIPVGIAIYEILDTVYPVYVSDKVCSMFGFTREEYDIRIANGMPVSFIPEGIKNKDDISDTIIASGTMVFDRMHVQKKDGDWFWLRASCSFEKNNNGDLICYAVLDDISDEIKRQQKEKWLSERYRILNEYSDVITFDYSPNDDTMNLSIRLGPDSITDEVHKHYLESFAKNKRLYAEERASLYAAILQASSMAMSGSHDFRVDFYNTGFRWYRARYTSLADENGEVYRVVGRIDDINDIMVKREQMDLNSDIDQVTGLRSRESACKLIKLVLDEKPKDRYDAVLLIDISDYSYILKNQGNDAADRLAVSISQLLKNIFRSGDIISRFAENQFLAYMPSAGSSYPVEVKAANIRRKIESIVCSQKKCVKCRIGIAGICGSEVTFESVMENAQTALEKDKTSSSIIQDN